MVNPTIRRRSASPGQLPDALHPVLRRVYAQRGICDGAELNLELGGLLPPAGLKGIDAAAALLADAIAADRRIVIAGDYDADGATGTAVAILGLRALGATAVDYVVPNRFTMGYGLSPALAEMAAARGADLLVTVDNGIASVEGVAAAKSLGMQVLITDHHLAGLELPAADAIVNPNQPGCTFASKHLAGVGVMFYVLLATRAQLRLQNWFVAGRAEPNLAQLLDLVALGTVADLVKLDYNNRILVQQGLTRLRAGRTRPGVLALLAVAGRDASRLNAMDLGFVLGPRINAAGRLDDIRLGIECLLSDSEGSAAELARELERINRERRSLQAQMSLEAQLLVEEQQEVSERSRTVGVCLFDEDWHEGVVGLVATKIKDSLHRPAIAFARAQAPGVLKGSCRSVRGLHIRDALAAVDARNPGLIERFGGHAMAAGLSLPEHRLADFSAAFDAICREWLRPEQLEAIIESDGELDAQELNLETARVLAQAGPWGQGFAEPCFEGIFDIAEARLVGADQTHVKYRLRADGSEYAAMDFGGAERRLQRGRVRVVYFVSVNRYQDRESLDLSIEHLEPLAS